MSKGSGRGQAQRALARAASFGALVSLAVATTAGAAPASTSQNPPLTKIKVAIIAVEAAAQVMYAKDRGFFRKQGIDAEIVIVADGTLTVPAVLFRPGPVRGRPGRGARDPEVEQGARQGHRRRSGLRARNEHVGARRRARKAVHARP